MRLSQKEWGYVLILALVHFAHAVDFVIIMPLAPIFMEHFQIGPSTFSWLVSSYTWSSCFFGLIGALFVDRYDRKKILLVSFAGFLIGTGLCALAPSATFLILARILTGAFSGVMISTEFSIVADLFPHSRRGTAFGIVMSAFPVASILGIPLGIFLANRFDWHAPFWSLALFCILIWIAAYKFIPPVRAHLKKSAEKKAAHELFNFLKEPGPRTALFFSFVIVLSGFTVIPFIAASMTANMGIAPKDLDKVYLASGLLTFFTSQLFGRMTDRFGRHRMFLILGAASILPLYLITHLSSGGIVVAMLTTAFFMSLVSGRFVPAMALVTAAIQPHRRGRFMSMNTATYNLGAGFATWISGLIVVQTADGRLERFSWVGWMAMLLTLFSLLISRRVQEVDQREEEEISASSF